MLWQLAEGTAAGQRPRGAEILGELSRHRDFAAQGTRLEYIQKPPFIQTVQGAKAAELQHYGRDSRGFILFNTCNSMSFVFPQPALFQANLDFHRLDHALTNIFSNQVYLFMLPIV